MKKFAFVPMVALAFAACAESPTAVAPDVASFSYDGANTTVHGTFSYRMGGEGGTRIRENEPGINEEGKTHGWCHAGGEWENPSGNRSSSVPHSHCTAEGTEQIVITFAGVAARRHHNQEWIAFDLAESIKVRFQSSQKKMRGEGVLVTAAIYTDGSVFGTWTINLLSEYDQVSGNKFSTTGCPAGASECLAVNVNAVLRGLDGAIVATVPGRLYW